MLTPASQQITRSSRRPSSFACKAAMAVSGLLMGVFVVVHMIGNLKVYGGAEDFNSYAAWLRTVGYPAIPREGLLWALRVVLLASLIAHVWCAGILWRRSTQARGRHRAAWRLRSFTGRTMLVSGIVLLAFIVFHLLDLTTGHAGAATFQAPAGGQVYAYQNLVASFQRPLAAIAYIVAMLVLAAHLAHGLWTAAHDLGATGRRTLRAASIVAGVTAIAVLIGNASIPLAVLTGWLT